MGGRVLTGLGGCVSSKACKDCSSLHIGSLNVVIVELEGGMCVEVVEMLVVVDGTDAGLNLVFARSLYSYTPCSGRK
jgi:hypothetical protein